MKILRKIGSFFLDLFETIVIALSIFALIYLFLFQPHQVRGSSMYPNFHDGEYLLTDKISYQFSLPDRGDVVIFKAPGNEEYDYIKRIIGLPGERVEIENGQILVNGTPLKESYLPESLPTNSGSFLKEGRIILVKGDEYLVMGDNRPHSSDSRTWGPVPKGNIIGKAWIKYWPLEEAGQIPRPEY